MGSLPTAAELWLTIPWADYEKHMDDPSVGQLAFLRDVFGEVLAEYEPAAVLIAGCATGNGLDRIDAAVTRHVIGIDINGEYLEVARHRFGESIPRLDLRCGDLSTCEIEADSIDLIHAALVLEYVDPWRVVGRFAGWLRTGGVLVVVLQRPGKSNVTQTPVESVRCLEPVIRLVDTPTLDRIAIAAGLEPRRRDERLLASGKAFIVSQYVKL